MSDVRYRAPLEDEDFWPRRVGGWVVVGWDPCGCGCGRRIPHYVREDDLAEITTDPTEVGT